VPEARFVEPQQPGWIHAVASGNRPFARGAGDDELFDARGVPHHRLAGESLADPEVQLDRVAESRLERGRFDPEIVGGECGAERHHQ
jgi:hypothetical protein